MSFKKTSDDRLSTHEDNAYTSWLNKDFDLIESPEDIEVLNKDLDDEIEIIHISDEEKSHFFKTHTDSKSDEETYATTLEKNLIDTNTEIQKKYYVPSFLTFFIILITMTTILLAYSTTYL